MNAFYYIIHFFTLPFTGASPSSLARAPLLNVQLCKQNRHARASLLYVQSCKQNRHASFLCEGNGYSCTVIVTSP